MSDPSTPAQRDEYQRSLEAKLQPIRQMQAEGAGIIHVRVLCAANFERWARAALAGDPDGIRLIGSWDRLRTAPPKCTECNRQQGETAALWMLVPDMAARKCRIICGVVCSTCFQGEARMLRKLRGQLRQHLGVHAAGRA